MGDTERQEVGEEGDRLLEGMDEVNLELLCSTVVSQTQGKFQKQSNEEVETESHGGEFGAVLRMWDGEVLDCFDDRRIALESACCPCYRFGKNMGRTGFGSCVVQASVYLFLAIGGLGNLIVFVVTMRHCFLYLAMAFVISTGGYLGFYRRQIKRKFNIQGSDGSMDDCIYHGFCPCCTLSQEARTLEMNNVQDGTWHGRGDTICIGSHSEGSRAFFELHPPVSTKCPDPCRMLKSADVLINLEPGGL